MHGQQHILFLAQEPEGFWIRRPFQVQPLIEIHDKGANIVKDSSLVIKFELITRGETEIWNDASELSAVAGIADFKTLPCRKCVGLESSGIAISAQGYNLFCAFQFRRCLEYQQWIP